MIQLFQKKRTSEILKIAGFQSELILNEFDTLPTNIEILGSLDDNEFFNVLVNCKAVIIYQSPSSGALTKIPELLNAGIPIICDEISARNFHNITGVTMFSTEKDFFDLIEKEFHNSSIFNIQNSKYFDEFLEEINF